METSFKNRLTIQATHRNTGMKAKAFLSIFPKWILTGVTLGLIFWLTLAPKPLGENPPELFPGADKVVHALMFGFLTVVILLDYQRGQQWKKVPAPIIISAGLISSFIGVAIEFVQLYMHMGRGFEISDMVADIVGAVICMAAWALWQGNWSVTGRGDESQE